LNEKLKKTELMDELDERGVKYLCTDTVSMLRNKLAAELCGIQRVPSLLFNYPEADITLLQLGGYEIAACEHLHDIGKHIENLFHEILSRMGDDKNEVKDLLSSGVFDQKECKRGVDYRKGLIKAYEYFEEHYHDNNITRISLTLCEM